MSEKSALTGLKIGVIGTGNMGRAIVRGLVEKSVYPQNISVFDLSAKKLADLRKEASVRVSKSSRQCASLSDVLILAVKPNILLQLAQEIATAVSAETLVISVAAGVPLVKIESALPKTLAVIRVMPNMPALVGAGMSAFSLGRRAGAKHRRIAESILSAIGEKVEVPERWLDLVTAVSGSGPAYYFLLSEKLIEAAYELGMKVDVAKKLVYQTAAGAARVMAEGLEDPEILIGRVASKGGTTEAALKIFQKKGFGKIIQDAVKAALRRSKEIREGK